MKPRALPISASAGLRLGLHLLVLALSALTMVRVIITGAAGSVVLVIAVASVFVATYVAGTGRLRLSRAWLTLLTVEWIALVWLTPEAAYLVFPLFFLHLQVLPARIGPMAALGSALVAVLAIGTHGTFTVGGVVGPLVAATVAIAIGLGYRALQRESAERQRLIDELVRAQRLLADSERDQGMLAERSRLAGEIHDTVAQGLSSIQMLLHAAERVQPGGAGTEHLRLAREVAADNLVEARRFVRELTPPALGDAGLVGALRRLGASGRVEAPLVVHGDVRELPMPIETALLRIAQGALANVEKHAGTTSARLTMTYDEVGVRLEVVDEGVGFDLAGIASESKADSFGFNVMRRRVAELGGRLRVDAAPGRGTRVVVVIGSTA